MSLASIHRAENAHCSLYFIRLMLLGFITILLDELLLLFMTSRQTLD